jgi:hypothetical protein
MLDFGKLTEVGSGSGVWAGKVAAQPANRAANAPADVIDFPISDLAPVRGKLGIRVVERILVISLLLLHR